MKRMKRNDLVSVLVTLLIIYNVSYIYVNTSNTKLTEADVSDNEIPDDSAVKNYKRAALHIGVKSQDNYVPVFDKLISGDIISSHEVTSSKDGINLGMVIINLSPSFNVRDIKQSFAKRTINTLNTMFDRAGPSPIHLVIVTNKDSSKWTGFFLASYLGKRITLGAIQDRGFRFRKVRPFPSIKISLVDCDEISTEHPTFVTDMKNNINSILTADDKYRANFYYIAPLYHLAFTKLKHLLFIDASDLEFSSNIEELWAERNRTDKGEVLMSMGLDLAPHYHDYIMGLYGKGYDGPLGKPGQFQGLNTGVVIYNFEKMRQNKIYNDYLRTENAYNVLLRYKIPLNLAEQDFFTCINFEHPELIDILPCQYNTQVSLQYLTGRHEKDFKEFHYCDKKENIKIFHHNGCGPVPENCGHGRVKTFDEDRSLFSLHMDVEQFWRVLSNMILLIEQDGRKKIYYKIVVP